MAKFQDIFTGGRVSVAINTDITNTALNGLGFTEVLRLSAFPEIGYTRNSIKVPDFTSEDERTLIGRKSYADTSMTFSYIPGDAVHERIIALADSGTRIQFRVTVWMDSDRDYGTSSVFNGFLASDTFSGDSEAVATRSFNISIDKMITRGILDLTAQSGGTVNPLVITQDFPSVLNMTTAENHTLEIAVSGGYAPYTYRWYKDGQLTNLGSNTTSLEFVAGNVEVGSHVRHVIVIDSMGQSVQSNDCTVTITQA